MAELDKIYLFRMTHIENIPHILQCGITHSDSPNANPIYVPIGDNSIISTRNKFLLNNGKTLGDYIPFYFSKRTPMLYVIQKGYNSVVLTPAEKIVYCVSSIQKIIDNKKAISTNLDIINDNLYFNNEDYSLMFSERLNQFESFYSYEDIAHMFNI